MIRSERFLNLDKSDLSSELISMPYQDEITRLTVFLADVGAVNQKLAKSLAGISTCMDYLINLG